MNKVEISPLINGEVSLPEMRAGDYGVVTKSNTHPDSKGWIVARISSGFFFLNDGAFWTNEYAATRTYIQVRILPAGTKITITVGE